MINKRLSTIILCILFSGCCIRNSDPCFCTPPEPGIEAQALSWISPFNSSTAPIFEDKNGALDTLEIERIQDTEWTGGEECGTHGDREVAVLRSKSNNERLFSFSASQNVLVSFNIYEEPTSFIPGYLNTLGDEIIVFEENSDGELDENFEWQGESLRVIKIACESTDTSCDDYKMKSFIVSESLGLLEYVDMNGMKWSRIN